VHFTERDGLLREIGHSLIEVREPRIVGLPSFVSEEDLLDHHGNLEQCKRLIPANRADVAAGAFSVSVDDLILAQISSSMRDSGSCLAIRATRRPWT